MYSSGNFNLYKKNLIVLLSVLAPLSLSSLKEDILRHRLFIDSDQMPTWVHYCFCLIMQLSPTTFLLLLLIFFYRYIEVFYVSIFTVFLLCFFTGMFCFDNWLSRNWRKALFENKTKEWGFEKILSISQYFCERNSVFHRIVTSRWRLL